MKLLIGSVLLVLLVGNIVFLVFFFYPPQPQNSAYSLIRVESQHPYSVFNLEEERSQEEYKLYQGTQVQLIKSPVVLTPALRKRSVHSQPMMRAIPFEDQVEYLSDRLDVYFLEGSEILEIRLSGDEAEDDLLAIVEAVTDSYMDEVAFKEIKDRNLKQENLKNELDQVRKEIDDKTTTLISKAENSSGRNIEVDNLNAQIAVLREVERELALKLKRWQIEEDTTPLSRIHLVQLPTIEDETNKRED